MKNMGKLEKTKQQNSSTKTQNKNISNSCKVQIKNRLALLNSTDCKLEQWTETRGTIREECKD